MLDYIFGNMSERSFKGILPLIMNAYIASFMASKKMNAKAVVSLIPLSSIYRDGKF